MTAANKLTAPESLLSSSRFYC